MTNNGQNGAHTERGGKGGIFGKRLYSNKTYLDIINSHWFTNTKMFLVLRHANYTTLYILKQFLTPNHKHIVKKQLGRDKNPSFAGFIFLVATKI